MKLYYVHCYTMCLYIDCMSPMGHCLLKKWMCTDIEITFLMLIIIEFLTGVKIFFSIVWMGTDCSVLRFFSIDNNVKIYLQLERAGQKLSLHVWPLEILLSYIIILHWEWSNMNVTNITHNNMHYCYCLLLLFLACTYDLLLEILLDSSILQILKL